MLQPALTLAEQLKKETAVVVTSAGEHSFEVEIADRNDARNRGLMFRRSLGQWAGMLFFYDREQHISMWMRNTYIPLDMIFITAEGTVHRIEERTEPFSERVIESGARVLGVLEVAGGTAAEIGLRPGDRVKHPRFGPANAR
ncbi:MAG: DUF192 domain-containing protein [Hyphomicrobiales bacterium]|nr:DUF192 domain-containing protein [Hyphomicrobiales bacterium]